MSLSQFLKNRISLIRWIVLGAVVLSSSSAFSTPNPDPGVGKVSPNPDRGLYIFQAYCVGCHGENGRGDGPMAGKLFRDFGVRPSDLANVSFQDSQNDLQLAHTIKDGGKASNMTSYMPAWGATLTDRQTTDLIAFLRELKPRQVELAASIVSVGDELELGRVLYTVRCLACHGPSGVGDGPFLEGLTQGGSTLAKLPDFSDYQFFRERSDQDLEEVLFTGVSHSGLLPATEPGWWDRVLEPSEKTALFFYLRALSLQGSKGKG